jgi:4-hydroxy-tetrahydrodipicolinate synthase
MKVNWKGVFPALMTEFKKDGSLDLAATKKHVEAMLKAGVDGFIMLGTLGENLSLTPAEKSAVRRCAVEAVKGKVPVVSGIAEYTSAFAIERGREAKMDGCTGLMVLPCMVYKTDPEETLVHFETVADRVDLPVMIYNNPVTYATDVKPAGFARLAAKKNIVAIKESSDDVRRVTDLRNEVGDRFLIFCGVDDIVLESVALGCDGWVAGLVNAFPDESVALYRLAAQGKVKEALSLYRWFMPLLHLDCHTKLVQYIKLANAMTGLGSEWTRAPRLPLVGEERKRVQAIIQKAIDSRPKLKGTAKNGSKRGLAVAAE